MSRQTVFSVFLILFCVQALANHAVNRLGAAAVRAARPSDDSLLVNEKQDEPKGDEKNEKPMDLDAFKKKIAEAKKAGAKNIILKLSNPARCPACKRLDMAIDKSDLKGSKESPILELNIDEVDDKNTLMALLRTIGLPDGYTIPHVFLFRLEKDGDWISHYHSLDSSKSTVDGIKSHLKTFDEKK